MLPLDWLDPDIAACIEVALLGVIDGFDHDVAVRPSATKRSSGWRGTASYCACPRWSASCSPVR